MNRQLVGFDFDKTLTDKDTIFGFYRSVSTNNFVFSIKRVLYLGFVLALKLRIISNFRLKQMGVFLFLRGYKVSEILDAAKIYSTQIDLNEIYTRHFLMVEPKDRFIISASFEEYLQFVFPNEKVFASSLSYRNGKALGLKSNLYGQKKKELLQQIEEIHSLFAFYTDSYSDQPLMDISENVYLVRKGEVTKIK